MAAKAKYPNRIMYEIADWHIDGLPSFFEAYNPYARESITASNSGNYHPNGVAYQAQNEFLSKPKLWCLDVIAGIQAKNNGEKGLQMAGKFLHDAALYGFSVEELALQHIQGIENRGYSKVERILDEISREQGVSKGELEGILEARRGLVTFFKTGYGTRQAFMSGGNQHKFRQAVRRHPSEKPLHPLGV